MLIVWRPSWIDQHNGAVPLCIWGQTFQGVGFACAQFILEPLYKIYSQVLGEPESSVKAMLAEFGVYLKPSAFRQDVKPLLKDACASIFGSATGLTDMMVRHFPSSRAASATKVSCHTAQARAHVPRPLLELPLIQYTLSTTHCSVRGRIVRACLV